MSVKSEQLLEELLEEVRAIRSAVEGNAVEGEDMIDLTSPMSVLEGLQGGVYTLTWNTSNGQKTMEVTLDEDVVPDQVALNEALCHNTGSDFFKVWSPDRGGWRSFYVADIVDLVPVE
jgi:hypothetical protein